MEVGASNLGELLREAVGAHRRMWGSAGQMADADCRGPSLLPGWSRGHVLAHWARNADGQSRMLLAAMYGEIAGQYPGGDAQRDREINAVRRPAATTGHGHPGCPVPGHANTLSTATDISGEVKRRLLPGLKAGAATPPS
jgi:hypothetical protein